MIQNETSSPILQMHLCSVEFVHDSGLIDARSERGKFFTKINVASNGIDGALSLGGKCIVFTDGSQKFAIAGIQYVDKNDAGDESIHTFKDDLVDWNIAKTIGVKNEYGDSAKVIVSPGAGIIIDSGNWCMTHYSPGMRKIIQYFERYESISPGHYQSLTHDGEKTKAEYRWHTDVDDSALDRVLAHKKPDSTGHTFSVNIQRKDDDVISMLLSDEGDAMISIDIKSDGSIEIDSQGHARVLAKGNIRIESTNDSSEVYASQDVYLGRDNSRQKKVALAPNVVRDMNGFRQDYIVHQHSFVAPLLPLPGPPIPTAPAVPPLKSGAVPNLYIPTTLETHTFDDGAENTHASDKP